MKRLVLMVLMAGAGAVAAAPGGQPRRQVGAQADGTYLVPTGQRVERGAFTFDGRVLDVAVRPGGTGLAVVTSRGLVYAPLPAGPYRYAPIRGGPSFHGCVWSPDGATVYVSTAAGGVQVVRVTESGLESAGHWRPRALDEPRNPVPGGMAITRDGATLFVCCANAGTVVELDARTGHRLRKWRAQQIPFDVKLSSDEQTLVVSNWGGRPAVSGEDVAGSGGVWLVVDRRGVPATGSVSLIDRRSGGATHVPVGVHPTGLAVAGGRAWVANAGSDTVSEIDLAGARVSRTFRLRWALRRLFGSMPNALAVRGDRLYACSAGDNSLCEVDLATGSVAGHRPAGWFPLAVGLSPDGAWAYVANSKGNGSVRRLRPGTPGNVHQFEGTVSAVDLRADVRRATRRVAALNGWSAGERPYVPPKAVYRGAIRHVLYVVKENRTYDEVFGDMLGGNGDARLCGLGEAITPNHHALSREFALFDNAYVSGTNSAEGHQWALEGLSNDYVERFYGGYTRGYPFDGSDAMAYSTGGFLWNAASMGGRTMRVYGEFCRSSMARIEPRPKGWLDLWLDRQDRTRRFRIHAGTSVASLRRHINPHVVCWPLTVSDQWRADEFIREYSFLSRIDRVPNVMLLTLPSDHTMGAMPGYPTPRSMVADNDLALGRVVDAVSHSPQWKDTCIFVMEDDAQAGPDHVDGHRTVCLVVSPYVRRGAIDSGLYTQLSILRSIELMLGLEPMTRFDALAAPFDACFTDRPDVRPYAVRPSAIPLAEMNPPFGQLRGARREMARRSAALDWSDVDTADWRELNRIVWHSLHEGAPYPTR